MAPADPSSSFRSDIEGLRGIAVLIVVAFHCRIAGFSGGFIGVDVFFVLSGYLITGLLVAEIQKASRLNLLQFYARRARRLLPASALTLFTTLAVGALVLAPHELTFAARAARATAVYLSNVFFAINAADYFAPGVETNPMLHTWSLAVEEQFYLVWPLLIMLGLQVWRTKTALVAILTGLTLASLMASLWFTATAGTFAFYGLPTRAWEFGIGGLAVLLPHNALGLRPSGWLTIGWMGVLAVLASSYAISADTAFPGWVALVPVMGTVAALVACARLPHRGVGFLLDWRALQLLGTLSYSWYLWHWPFLVIAAALFPGISTWGRVFVAACSLAVAAATHRLVENPIRFHRGLVRRPALSLALAGVLTMLSVGASLLAARFAQRLEVATELASFAAAVHDIARMPRDRCVSLGASTDVKTCVFGDASSSTHVVLFGDSHAIQWFNPLELIADSNGWKLTTMVKSGCPAIAIRLRGTSASAADSCEAWRSQAIRHIVTLRPSLVILGSATSDLPRPDRTARRSRISLEEWRAGTRRTLETLAGSGLRVVVMRDNPRPSFDIPTCLARSARHTWYPGGSCEIDRAAALDPAIFEAERTAAQGLSGVGFVDMTDHLCDRTRCWAILGNEVVYRDNNHLTGAFAESLAPRLEAMLRPIITRRRSAPLNAPGIREISQPAR